MQPREGNRNRTDASRPHPDSLDSSADSKGFGDLKTTSPIDKEIDLKMVEALARIERVRSKALAALGTMIKAG